MSSLLDAIRRLPAAHTHGRLKRMSGLLLEATGCYLATGDRCLIQGSGEQQVEAEVIGFSGERHFLMPLTNPTGLRPGDRVKPLSDDCDIPVGEALLGRVLDGLGQPLDGKPPIATKENIRLHAEPINPLSRKPISAPLDVGVRAINGLLTVGKGQRMGLFAGSGVGKSVLLGMMTRNTAADITIVGMIGERGREVKEFIEQTLGHNGLKRSLVIAAPADSSPVMRLRAAQLCHRIAEYFRDQGKDVLLLMDSLTRYAQAQREIALSVGEPPTSKGYPPSVFALIPKLVERAGNGSVGSGSITAFYTVLAEGDDQQDPVADAARSVLDGHIVLSRELADSGHYPAIDIGASISRSVPAITSEQHQQYMQTFRHTYSRYLQLQDLIAIGAYQKGSDQELDRAMELHPLLQGYLRQGMFEQIDRENSISQLLSIWPVEQVAPASASTTDALVKQ
ncbi:flagellar protein export ATPase FliI [Sansalvadorimonas verongulae]|uniref:flagellar protein export ATPase FliI n=1 Tax=Sansalvadorimonas verongulae TaxID=2172824 RepID=UPI0012BC32ED|nr:flagellar protein export ATPase FliI [Sansalvadorimonas verongulae]MTI13478.1 flagellar protein export ATPase FliI [Sansalvadorimonas verongulae]